MLGMLLAHYDVGSCVILVAN